MTVRLGLFASLVLAAGCGGRGADRVQAVRDDRIQFVTYRPAGSQFALLGRRVAVTGPAELVELTRRGDLALLDELVELLRVRDRAWAAEVMLATLTGREQDIVNAFASNPSGWWDAVGNTAHERWAAWLQQARDRLAWDASASVFVEVPRP